MPLIKCAITTHFSWINWSWYIFQPFWYLTGLYTGDVQLRSTRAIHTRQNPNGDRYGYECPEERDYYPYWHPTSWRDIAVMASNKTFCENYYQKESFNVKPKCKSMFRVQIWEVRFEEKISILYPDYIGSFYMLLYQKHI